jgi:WD40 repeat protein
LYMFRISSGSIVKIFSIKTTAPITSFDISPDGGLLLGTNSAEDSLNNIDLFKITDTAIKFHGKVAVPEKGPRPFKPFAARFSPSGDTAIVLNGEGNPYTGSLNSALIIDMKANPPHIRDSVPDIADGLENVAFHPNEHMAVIACLDDHIAVIDLKSDKPEVLYYLEAGGLPEGIEFSPDGSQLFLGLTGKSHFAVYEVDGYKLTKNPITLQTGHHPVAMAIWAKQ